MIKRETRKNIIDHFNMEEFHFSGRMNDLEFLERLYDLHKLPSIDSRYDDAAGDIQQHTVNNYDYQGNWVFSDDRFELLGGANETFLRFICEMVHPLVRTDAKEAKRITVIANDWLREDGWELYPIKEIAGGKVFSFRQINAIQKPKDSEVAHIWEPDKLRFFISHRDKHKIDAKKLAEELKGYGISSFVAHDSIQAMSTWKNEIMKALQTMDAFICYITEDFYKSEWTNQEVGFALARGIPIYLFSVDKTDPKGFKLDTQAIKTGISELANCIKRDFSNNVSFKKPFINAFIRSRDGSYHHAKTTFYDLVGLRFNDSEIEEIIEAINAKTGIREPRNKLHAILSDGIEERHQKNPLLRGYASYRQYLENDIVAHHTTRLFKIKESDLGDAKLIEIGKKHK